MTMISQCIFPAELICQILYHTDPPDIVRWRTVSKWFCALTYDTVLWKNLYTDAPFPRPPGPFPSQSNASLERDLVKSVRLAQSWTTRPVRDASCVRIKLKGYTTMIPKLIHGRWLVTQAGELDPRQFILHDTETGARRVLWEQLTPAAPSWGVCSITSPEGQCVVYVFLEPAERHRWKLLEFRLNAESGELVDSVVMDGPAVTYIHYGSDKFRAGKSPFLYIPRRGLVFDTRTRIFYEFPKSLVAWDETFRYIHKITSTDTYIISLSQHPTVIQVFTLPPDGSSVKNEKGVLCLTHEGVSVMKDFHATNVEVLKPLVDPVTGATHLKLLDCARDFQITRIDLTLPEPHADDVSPMTVEMRRYGLPTRKEDPTSNRGTWFQFVDISEGHVRGFYRRRCGAYCETDHVMKFTIDTRQDEWVINHGELSHTEWSRIPEIIMFDGMRGKIYIF